MKPSNRISRRALGRMRNAGFSLLELMVALTILAIALIPVAYFYSKSLQMVEESSIRTRALMLAQERITEIRQMPYDQIRSNITPSAEQIKLYSSAGVINTSAADWYGYDLETSGTTPPQWQAMFSFPLPLDFNPYQPQTQGYNNALNVNHYSPFNPVAGVSDSNVNFNGGNSLDYEYEPIGFYTQKIYNRNKLLVGPDRTDVEMADRRTLSLIEPSIDEGNDYFRSGNDQQVDNYSIYGRRTIILDVIPDPQDTDPSLPVPDNYAPDDDFDGGATPVDPWPLGKGPDNKFQVVSGFGSRGKLVIVQVFWLPRKAPNAYIAADDLNKIELKTFIAANNDTSTLGASSGDLTRNDYLMLTPPS